MSRRIETGLAPGAGGAVGQNPQEDYLGRLAKYIPSEVLALYVAMIAAVPVSDPHHGTILWVIFFANLVLVPIYMWIVTSRDPGKEALWEQVILASIAFPVWAFAMGEPFKEFSWYQGWIATMLLMFLTVVFGLVSPKAGS